MIPPSLTTLSLLHHHSHVVHCLPPYTSPLTSTLTSLHPHLTFTLTSLPHTKFNDYHARQASAFLEAGLLYPREWCSHIYLYGPGAQGQAELGCDSFFGAWDWDQLEGVAETLVVPDTSGVGGSGGWGQGSGQ